MREPRLYLPGPLESGSSCALSGEVHHYLTRVLRLRVGAALVVFDGRGGEYRAVVDSIARHEAVIRVGEHRAVEREPPVTLRLAQGIGRGERSDLAVQKAVELGATHIVLLLTEHGVVRLEAERAARRTRHWQGIATHAAQQCGRTRLARVEGVHRLRDWLPTLADGGLRLVLDPEAGEPLGTGLYPGGPITLLVGPEGGLSAAELAAARGHGFVAVRLGPRTLRTETAAIAGLAAVQLLWGDLALP
ncbi:MAG: 16S rRNA (uracil(1498)-N(3))-methyltransferase [Gammaproteobacteria bacterium]|nr:16S rRNA (uracil(1498)-N(3))-methyltransferase [Gammaproteobacteria bacterium]